MSIILYKYHYANLGPLLQTYKFRVQSSSTFIYGTNNNIFTHTEHTNIFYLIHSF